MGKGLPDRWLDYKSIGREIRGVPIIACKVPLREDLLRNRLHQKQWFTPDNLMEMVPNVGCIVDLTATYRYYDPMVFTERGIHHAKILCEGHVIPRSTTVQRFFQVVDEFLHNVHSRGKVLMVHCTHGLNRTGYLVSRYMVERRGFQPDDAIQAFNYARGHNIERANYLEDLYQMSQRVCRNPIPLFQKSDPHPVYVEQAAANYDQPPSFPSPLLGQYRCVPPPAAYSCEELQSSVSKPSRRYPAVPNHGQRQFNSRQGTGFGDHIHLLPRENNPRHLRFTDEPLPLPTIEKHPNLKWIASENPPDRLGNSDDRPSSANRNLSEDKPESSQPGPSSPPVKTKRKKSKRNKLPPVPPVVAESRDRSKNRKCVTIDSSIEILSNSSIEICYESRQAKPCEPTAPSSSASHQELVPPASKKKKKRSKSSKSAQRSKEASMPSEHLV